jgi:hypothetical protein
VDGNSEVKVLLQRLYEIQDAMRRPGGVRITVERELLTIRERLGEYAPPNVAMRTGALASKSELQSH